jgi:hypothetical protein
VARQALSADRLGFRGLIFPEEKNDVVVNIMGIFDSIRNVGSRIFDGFRSGVNKIIDVGSSVRNGIRKGYNVVKKIPVIGAAVDKVIDLEGPGGISLRKVAEAGNEALDRLQNLASNEEVKAPPPPLQDIPLKRLRGRKAKGAVQ